MLENKKGEEAWIICDVMMKNDWESQCHWCITVEGGKN